MKNKYLNEYFSKYWPSESSSMDYRFSGYESVKTIIKRYFNSNQFHYKNVLDVGCGNNHFKLYDYVDEFIGIDPYNENADINISIEQLKESFKEEKFPVVLCLGSVNFGNFETIKKQFSIIYDMTEKNGIQIWRVNPGLTHTHTRYKDISKIEFFPWNIDILKDLIKDTTLKLIDYRRDYKIDDMENKNRLFFILKKE